MRISNEEKKKEALLRMDALKLPKDIKLAFADKGTVMVAVDMANIVSSAKKSIIEIIKQEEKTHDILVYYSMYNETPYGAMLSLLYVSDFKSDWSLDMEYTTKLIPIAYVHNLDYPENSEFGGIRVKWEDGRLIRVE